MCWMARHASAQCRAPSRRGQRPAGCTSIFCLARAPAASRASSKEAMRAAWYMYSWELLSVKSVAAVPPWPIAQCHQCRGMQKK
jgi:hypothetical protein